MATKTVRTKITAAQVAAAQGGTDGDQRLVTVECPADYDAELITAAEIVGDPAIRVVSPDVDGYANGRLVDYDTADVIRPATADELAASRAAAERDGGRGVIEVDGRSCYVEE